MPGPLPRNTYLYVMPLLAFGVVADPPPVPPPPSPSSPWMDTSGCSLSDSLMVCQLKKGLCSPISTVFSPPGGPVKAITTCANNTGTVLGPQFFMSVGLTFLAGSPESLSDKASSDPTTASAIRRCALNATGLLNPDLLTLNRTTVSNSLSSSFITPELGAAVAAAVASCPEPVDYKLTGFMKCLKVACMNNVAVTPFMTMATSTLTGPGAPAAAAAALIASKTPPPKSPPPGAAAYSAGGAFPYAGAGGAGTGTSSGSGPASYMAGAYPFAGAGSFPYAGAAGATSGAGAFPYAGAGSGAPGAGASPAAGGFSGASGAGAFSGTSSGAAGAGAFPYAGAGGAGGSSYLSSSAGAATAPKTT